MYSYFCVNDEKISLSLEEKITFYIRTFVGSRLRRQVDIASHNEIPNNRRAGRCVVISKFVEIPAEKYPS